jgi:hypothetical protein
MVVVGTISATSGQPISYAEQADKFAKIAPRQTVRVKATRARTYRHAVRCRARVAAKTVYAKWDIRIKLVAKVDKLV